MPLKKQSPPAPHRRLRLSLIKTPAISMTRHGLAPQPEVCYLVAANKLFEYEGGWSRLLYIGRTGNGITRVAESAAKAVRDGWLDHHGVTDLSVHVVSYGAVRRARRESPLEGALLFAFQDLYGGLPKQNQHGTRSTWRELSPFFSHEALCKVLLYFGYTKSALRA